MSLRSADAVVIGGGFYGATIAAYLVRSRGLRKVLLVEREDALMARATRVNQARVHNGYHYPRSFTTAFRSRMNMPRFVRDYAPAVESGHVALYAIARNRSHVTARQFERFCAAIGAPLEEAPAGLAALFEPRLVERVFRVQEVLFDARRLARMVGDELATLGVEVLLGTRAVGVAAGGGGRALRVDLAAGDAQGRAVECGLVFNCAYSGLNHVDAASCRAATRLKHEIAELALVEAPPALRDVGVTLMDGPFFSLLPHPARGLHTLSHVRYTPHESFADTPEVDPYARLRAAPRDTRADRMLRDAARYLPVLAEALPQGSMFEVKTVLADSEVDDGRPILFERHAGLPGLYMILGGKIDNVYDVLERLDAESW